MRANLREQARVADRRQAEEASARESDSRAPTIHTDRRQREEVCSFTQILKKVAPAENADAHTKKARTIGWTIDMRSRPRGEPPRRQADEERRPHQRGVDPNALIAAPNATTINSASKGEDVKREAIAFRVPVVPGGSRRLSHYSSVL